MSADLRLATVYVMPLGGKDIEAVLEALERNKRFLRGEIARHVNLKFAPDIRFRVDERFAEAERIEKLLRTPAVQRDLKRDEGESMTQDDLPNRRSPTSTAHQSGAAEEAAAIPPREARRARLDRARQAGRHDLDPGGRRRQAPVLVQARRPRRHARSAGLRLPADRARRGDQDRSLRHGRPQGLSLHRALGRGARHRRCRGPRGRDQRRAPDRDGDRGAAAALHRHDLAGAAAISRRSRSTASAPTTSPATARRSICRPGRSRSTGSSWWTCPTPITAEFEAECGKGTYVRSLARDIGRALGCLRPCHGVAARRRSARSAKTT